MAPAALNARFQRFLTAGNTRKNFDPEELRNLAESILENGVLQPITVYANPEIPHSYMIVTGERRFRAAKLAGLTSVPCILRASDFDRSRVDQEQLVENIQRADLAPIEAARALSELMKRHQYSQREAAKKLGKPLMFVNELISILKIPDDLLEQNGVATLPKQVLVELSRATPSEQPKLLEQALRGAPLLQVQQQRSNRKTRPTVVYYHETFPIDGQPPVELRWKKHPDEVTATDLVEVLGHVARQLINRTTKH